MVVDKIMELSVLMLSREDDSIQLACAQRNVFKIQK